MKKIGVETFLEYNFLSEVSISPDGKYTAFIKSVASLEDNNYTGNLYLMCNETKKTKQLTTIGTVRAFTWTDDKTIIFPAVRDDKTKEKLKNGEELTVYYKINIKGGEAVEVFTLPILSGKLTKISNDSYLVNALYDNNRPCLEGLSKAEKLEVLKEYKNSGYTIFEELPFWGNAQGVINRKRNRLYIYNEKTKDLSAITNEMFGVMNFKADNDKVVYLGSEYEDVRPTRQGMYVYNFNTKETKCLIEPNTFGVRTFELYEDNTAVFVGTDNTKYGMNENGDLYKINLTSGEKHMFFKHDYLAVGSNSTNSDVRYGAGKMSMVEGDVFYYLTTDVNFGYLCSINLKTSERKQISKISSVDCFDVKDGKIYAVAQEVNTLAEIYKIKEGKAKKLTDFNEFVKKEYSAVTPEALTVHNRDGIDIHGFVLKPANYVKGNSYPAILHIHGGPRTVFSDIFHHEMQMWANEGYFVLYSNPRGSDGRGNEFGDIRGQYGGIDYNDLMDFTDKALDTYKDIDANRVGVTGGSYGGFMTNWIIGQTDRFKAACAQRSIANWTSFEGTTDIGYFFAPDQTAASHTTSWAKQWEQSPLRNANKAKTPTLFIHAEEDYRCWMVEALQMFTALKMHNVPSRMCLIKGENHELSRSGKPRNRVVRMNEILNWMNSYLK